MTRTVSSRVPNVLKHFPGRQAPLSITEQCAGRAAPQLGPALWGGGAHPGGALRWRTEWYAGKPPEASYGGRQAGRKSRKELTLRHG